MPRRSVRSIATSLVALLTVACANPAPPQRHEAASPPPAEPAAPARADRPTERVLDVGALAPFSYAGIRYEPQLAVIDASTTAPARVRLALQASAPARFEVPLDAELRLTFANGARVAAPLPSLGASEVRVVEVAGAVPADTGWDGATLTVAEAGREPLVIRLGEGSQDASALEAGEGVRAPNYYGEQVAYEVTSAALELDGPRRGGFYGRAPEGQRFLRVRVAATNEGGRHGVSIGEEAFAMTTDAGPAVISLGVTAQTVALRQRADFEVIFLVPATSKRFTLQVGADGKAPGSITLTRPEPDGSGRRDPTP